MSTTIPAFDDNVLSFNKALEISETPFDTKPSGPKKLIRREIFIDKFNVKRVRIEKTPSVCDVCAFDVAAKVHGNWWNVPPHRQIDVVQALEEHKKEEHPVKMDLIIDESELPTEWLGNKSLL